jgi:putative FmdB family regulatory protein
MPIYEYQCTGCGHDFEVLQGINETPELSCDNCGGVEIERLLSPGAFVFKGSGFYITDYKNKEKGKEKGKTKAKAKEQAPSCDSCAKGGGCSAAANDA